MFLNPIIVSRGTNNKTILFFSSLGVKRTQRIYYNLIPVIMEPVELFLKNNSNPFCS